MPIDGVFFDLVGTLIRSRGSIGEQYASFARRFGASDADPARVGRAFREAMRQAPPMAFPGRSVEETAAAERAWWRELVAEVVGQARLGEALNGQVFERFFASLYDHFTTAEAWEPYPDAVPALQRLRFGGLTVGLITNYDTRVYPVLDAVGLAPLLDSVSIPALVGAAKPEPAIFLRALDAHALEPQRAMFIGDELADDYAGAEAVGMLAVLLDREDRHLAEGLRRISDLGQLDEVLRAGW